MKPQFHMLLQKRDAINCNPLPSPLFLIKNFESKLQAHLNNVSHLFNSGISIIQLEVFFFKTSDAYFLARQ